MPGHALGPILRDWMTYVDENLDQLLSKPLPLPMPGGLPAQVIGTGPTVHYSARPEMFEALMFAARRESGLLRAGRLPAQCAVHDRLPGRGPRLPRGCRWLILQITSAPLSEHDGFQPTRCRPALDRRTVSFDGYWSPRGP